MHALLSVLGPFGDWSEWFPPLLLADLSSLVCWDLFRLDMVGLFCEGESLVVGDVARVGVVVAIWMPSMFLV